ncbi:MAG: biotin synthase BioB [Candidatus Omnitrophica bacterium]|nr:biotin synthase BioB [Candidatus Omnitrophota bacterium]MBU4149212.1 biotin synthase BioB [Candidatus Omnitrophota bacterium]
MIKSILEEILSGKELEFDKAEILLGAGQDDLHLIMRAANIIRKRFCGERIDLCSLINAKSGLCSEDCKFCAQSVRYKTGCEVYSLVSVEDMVSAARLAKKQGAANFCIVISGGGPSKEEFEKIKEAIEKIKTIGIKVDCSLGSLQIGMVKELKSLGIDRFNHNLETSREFYKDICATHSYESRVSMVGMLKDVGVEPCCGGIIGLGESPKERLNLAFALKKMGIGCVPVNILDPRKGTPLEYVKPIEPLEAIKTIATFRLILPKAIIKVAGGRESGLRDLQAMAFMAGANGMIIGGYLTTKGRSVEKDLQMVKDLGFEVK